MNSNRQIKAIYILYQQTDVPQILPRPKRQQSLHSQGSPRRRLLHLQRSPRPLQSRRQVQQRKNGMQGKIRTAHHPSRGSQVLIHSIITPIIIAVISVLPSFTSLWPRLDHLQDLLHLAPHHFHELPKLLLTHPAYLTDLFAQDESIRGLSQSLIVRFEDSLEISWAAADDIIVFHLCFCSDFVALKLHLLHRPLTLRQQIGLIKLIVLLRGAM